MTPVLNPGGGNTSDVPSIEAYGHSWVNYFGATNARYGYIDRLAKMLGNAVVNRLGTNGGAVSSNAANGGVANLLNNGVATDLVAGPYVTRGGVKICQAGFNDFITYQAIANGNAFVESCLASAFSRLLAARIIAALTAGPVLNAALTYTGAGWTAFADATISLSPGFAFNSTTQGCSVSFQTDAAYNGEAITAFLPTGGSGGALATLSWDGHNVATTDAGAFSAAVVAGGSGIGGTPIVRVPAGVIPPGAHTIAVTYTTVTQASFGGFIIEGAAPLLVPSIPYVADASYSNAKADWNNARNRQALAAFPSGRFVDLTSALSPNFPNAVDLANWGSGGTAGHPNNLGNQNIAAVLQPAARGLLAPAAAAGLNL